ncbi:hypothetical protein [Candidatus Tisiphia endosymbiont of Parasteatoda lunata]|uniref:hypothetical protein n=1 Tax=Candidatus Tisiphia endosymbiont of Parasteatoda lunata TaxID=3066275 RepID=UPI003977E3D2
MAHLESVTTQKNISVKCKILLKNILSFLDKIFKIYVETTHCKCGVFLPKWDNKSQVKSIELELGKSANHDILQKFQWQIKSLERFTTKENINTALQIYKEKGIESFILYSKNSCSKAIEQKITKDLQIMKNKFAPNYNLGSVRFCDIVVNHSALQVQSLILRHECLMYVLT